MRATDELGAVDTFFAGTLKGVGKVFMQTVLDCFSRYVWARLYTSKMPVTAVQVLNNHAMPFFEEHGVKVMTILSDNGREYRGRKDHHLYELFLRLEEIDQRTTQVGRRQSNGYIERFHRTLFEEHMRIEGGTTWQEMAAVMRKDLDAYPDTYNRHRPHRGRGMEGRTPYEALRAGIPTKSPARKKPARNEVKTAAWTLTSARPGVRRIPYLYNLLDYLHARISSLPSTSCAHSMYRNSLSLYSHLRGSSLADYGSLPVLVPKR